MMKSLLKVRNFLLAALLVCAASAGAQSITGSTSVNQGSTLTYSWTAPPNGQYVNFAYGTATVTGGIIVESNATTCPMSYTSTFNVRWTGAVGAGKISVVYYQYITPPMSNPFLAGPYTKELNVTIGVAPVSLLTGKQSVGISENVQYTWKFIPPAQNAQYVSGTMKVVGGVFVENNATTIAAGSIKHAMVRWLGPVGNGSVSITYSFRVGPFGPNNFYETVTKTETLNVSITGGGSICTGMVGTADFASLSGNQCPALNSVGYYSWKYINQYPLSFQRATIRVTGGVIRETNTSVVVLGPQFNFSVLWTSPGNQSVSVTYEFIVVPNGLHNSPTITLPVTVSASALRASEVEEIESVVATENLIYPNPAIAGSEVYINVAGSTIAKVIVRNLEGQTQNTDVVVGEKISIATQGLSKGMYVVQVITEEGKSTTHKFSVE